jgi:hypothetical protein
LAAFIANSKGESSYDVDSGESVTVTGVVKVSVLVALVAVVAVVAEEAEDVTTVADKEVKFTLNF